MNRLLISDFFHLFVWFIYIYFELTVCPSVSPAFTYHFSYSLSIFGVLEVHMSY
jgi:hypothetical protein